MMYSYNVLVIGSGAAGYAVAERLAGFGVEKVCIVTECRTAGTSRNAGSDKQTYYKLDISSSDGDSVLDMARDLKSGGAMNGSDAFLEAANSVRCFMHLVELGVPFPYDDYGVYPGYQTDHDRTNRATSAGPLTSKYMTEKLEKKVLSEGVGILDGYKAVRLIVSEGRCCGAYCLFNGKIVPVTARATVLCTGAPSAIYADSVYPVGQSGATGLAIEAGCALSNFQEWQYGIASTSFRWNLSGSYQQVIPRYVSVDEDTTEREFLYGSENAFDNVFLKGYQWPFDYRKSSGSSSVDIMVSDEISAGRRVFLDYTKNPRNFTTDALGTEARDYLDRAGVDGATPFERLMQLNPAAVELYRDNGIDLEHEYLEIGVCAQHNNGGIKVDGNGETTVSGLFCAGEASGRFGVYRPGGAALNDTQVGALLISKYLRNSLPAAENVVLNNEPALPIVSAKSNISELDAYFGKRMSAYAGVFRNCEKIRELLSELENFFGHFTEKVTVSSDGEYADYFTLYHTTLARISLCRTILVSASAAGSRGGSISTDKGKILPENEEYRDCITLTQGDCVTFVKADDIPENDCVFEKLLSNFKG